MEGKDPDPRPARLGHDAGGLGHDHRARPQADARHGRRVPVAAAARRPNQGIRAERSAPRPEDRASGRPGDDLGPAGHPAQPARRVAARLRVPEKRHAGDRGRDWRGAQRAPPRPGAGVCRVRGQRRRAARGNPRRLPVAGAARSPRGLAAAVGARGPARDEGRRRGLGPAGRAGGGLDALLGSDRAESRAMSAFVTLDGVRKQWSHTVAVGPLSLEIPRGEILVLLGPSGSGKTTVLRLLGGFEAPDAGRIVLAGEDVTSVPPARRRCGMVFQHYALFPHLDVGANVAFGLTGRGTNDPKVAEVLALVGLEGFERRRVQELSGGQQQRVALARALAPEPRVLLLDEPLSNLDPSLRERTRRELRALIRRIGITTILVTHEQEEAFDLADHVALLRRGRLEQLGTPEELYDDPATGFVAEFIGRSSVLPVKLIAHEESLARVEVPGAPAPWLVPCPRPLAGSCRLHVRPEALRLVAAGGDALSGQVAERRFLGGAALYTVRLAGGESLEVAGEPDAARPGDRVGVVPDGRGLHLLPEEAS